MNTFVIWWVVSDKGVLKFIWHGCGCTSEKQRVGNHWTKNYVQAYWPTPASHWGRWPLAHSPSPDVVREPEDSHLWPSATVCFYGISLFYWLCVLPSMMEMCTALRRVRGTLVNRGPWVMEGQLLLGTMPALDKDTHPYAHMYIYTKCVNHC